MNVYIRNLCLELAKLGVTTDVFTCCHEDNQPCNFSGPTCHTGLIHINDARSRLITDSGPADYASSLAQAVNSHCREQDLHYDVIHSHYWLSGMAGNQLKYIWQIPHITMFHTLGALKNSSLPGSPEPESRIVHYGTVSHSCDRFIASTSIEKQAMVNRYGVSADKISVIPCGVNPALFRPIQRPAARAACGLPDKPTLLFVGRPDPIKGLKNLLQAVSLLGPDNNFQLLVIGCSNRRMGDPGQAAGYGSEGLRDRVIFTGPVDHEKMSLYYNAADLCVIPSYYESFCLTALESVACGTPVLATCVGEIPEISKLTTLCKMIPDNRPETLAAYISIYLKGNAPDVPHPGTELSMNYGWNSIADRVIREYRDALKVLVEAV